MAFKDKNQFEAGDSEDKFRTGPFPLESPDEEMETEPSEDELAEDVGPFTDADWKQEFPDYTAQENEEKLPEQTRSSWMAPVVSCLFGTFLGAAIAGVLVNTRTKPQQTRAFIIFFLVLAPLFSWIWYWLFDLRPQNLAKKMKEQQEARSGSESIHPE